MQASFCIATALYYKGQIYSFRNYLCDQDFGAEYPDDQRWCILILDSIQSSDSNIQFHRTRTHITWFGGVYTHRSCTRAHATRKFHVTYHISIDLSTNTNHSFGWAPIIPLRCSSLLSLLPCLSSIHLSSWMSGPEWDVLATHIYSLYMILTRYNQKKSIKVTAAWRERHLLQYDPTICRGAGY